MVFPRSLRGRGRGIPPDLLFLAFLEFLVFLSQGIPLFFECLSLLSQGC